MTASSLADDPHVALTGQHGLLTMLVTEVLQRGLEVELTAHLGYRFRGAGARSVENSRNGAYPKHLMTDLGMVELQMPRDRNGTFEPVTVPKHDRCRPVSTSRLVGLFASGITRAELCSQLNRTNRFKLTPETCEALASDLEPVVHVWQRRRFEPTCSMLLLDTISDGARPRDPFLDVAVATDARGDAQLLGVWRRKARVRGTDRWSPIFAELRYRGLTGPRIICGAGGDTHMAAAAENTWADPDVRSGVEELITNALR